MKHKRTPSGKPPTQKEKASSAPRRYPEGAPTTPPPPSSKDVPVYVDPFLSLPPPPLPPRDPEPTLTNEVELEQARLRSLAMSSVAPPRPSLAHDEPLLSLANAQAPTNPPPGPAQITEFPTAPPPPGAVEAVAKERGPEPIVEMRERYSLGDYTGALQIAEEIVQEHPGNAEAVTCAERCRVVLVKMYTARIGPLDRVPVLMVAQNQLKWLSIDHRAGFVLSHIDGTSSLEMILDVSGMAPLDCLRILFELVQQRIVSFR